MSTNSSPTPDDAVARYVVGIDLGTTNSAVAFVDSQQSSWHVQTFSIPQLVAPGQVESRETLPSCFYEAADGEFPPRSLRLPWSRKDPIDAVGFFARDQGTLVPGRQVASAKSWLCHTGVDRTAKLLPWHGASDVERRSPVEVSAQFLTHIREAWDAAHPDALLAQQDLVLTLPASFDEVARELTIQAAAKAKLPRVVLIEEPQAAFYAWVDRHRDDWETMVAPGQKILVCDVGGGTSDFTLIRVGRDEGDKIRFHRVAVGDHLILGGDNLDLALAHFVEGQLTSDGKLPPRSWSVLVRVCRQIKETLLADDAPAQTTLHLPGTGSALIGGGMQYELSRDEAQRLLVEGFFPQVPLDAAPDTHRSGFQEFGLPYAPDAAITRHLAAFLTAHRHVAQEEASPPPDFDPARPDVVLLNGGVFSSAVLRGRLLDTIGSWFSSEGAPWQPTVLDSGRLDLAVAWGAAYYGMVRRGQGVRISAALARTYYLGVEGGDAVCVVPASAEPGQELDRCDRQFELTLAQPVEFPLFISSTRLTDAPGAVVPIDAEQMRALPPVRTVLRSRQDDDETIHVALHARLTEIGTLDLWCAEEHGPRSWRLQFDVRSATQTDLDQHQAVGESAGFVDESTWADCRAVLADTFGPQGTGKPAHVIRRLADAADSERQQWPPSLLRRIWETLIEMESGRRQSQSHEARWLNLLGFALRPGYGMALDDWRVAETRRVVQGKLCHPAAAVGVEAWILWRRIAGGLSRGAQLALADPLLKPIRLTHRQIVSGRGHGGELAFRGRESIEAWRMLGSLELLNVDTKIELGTILLDLIDERKMEAVAPALAWALGRVGTRQPLYGPLNSVIPPEAVGAWLPRAMDLERDDPALVLAVMQLARRTNDRYRDIDQALRDNVLRWLTRQGAPAHFVELVRDGGRLDAEEQGRVFGESLPKGLRLR